MRPACLGAAPPPHPRARAVLSGCVCPKGQGVKGLLRALNPAAGQFCSVYLSQTHMCTPFRRSETQTLCVPDAGGTAAYDHACVAANAMQNPRESYNVFCPGGPEKEHDFLGYTSTLAECVKLAAARGVSRICLIQTGTEGAYFCSAGDINGKFVRRDVSNCNTPCKDGQCGGQVEGPWGQNGGEVRYWSTYALGKSEQPNLIMHLGLPRDPCRPCRPCLLQCCNPHTTSVWQP